MLGLSIHSRAESEALVAAFCVLGILLCVHLCEWERFDVGSSAPAHHYQLFLNNHISEHVESCQRLFPRYVLVYPTLCQQAEQGGFGQGT